MTPTRAGRPTGTARYMEKMMDIRISGHQVDVGDALKTHVQDRLQGIAYKYFSRTTSVSPAISLPTS